MSTFLLHEEPQGHHFSHKETQDCHTENLKETGDKTCFDQEEGNDCSRLGIVETPSILDDEGNERSRGEYVEVALGDEEDEEAKDRVGDLMPHNQSFRRLMSVSSTSFSSSDKVQCVV
jgi:hypothetical protein